MKNMQSNSIKKGNDETQNITNQDNSNFNFSYLNNEEKQSIKNIENTLDLNNTSSLLQFGIGVQSDIASFSDTMLNNINIDDSGVVGRILLNLVNIIKSVKVDEFIADMTDDNETFFEKFSNKPKRFYKDYQKAEEAIDEITDELNRQRMTLLKYIVMYDNLNEKNAKYIKNLDMYIIAGEEKQKYLNETLIPMLKEKASQTKDQIDIEKLNSAIEFENKLEHKIFDLKTTRTIAIQTIPQIKLLQSGNKILVEKIQTSILTTIPLWKNQILIASEISKQKETIEMQRKITKEANKILEKNAKSLKSNVNEIISDSSKLTSDIDKLKKLNKELIDVIDETIDINDKQVANKEETKKNIVLLEDILKEKIQESKQ